MRMKRLIPIALPLLGGCMLIPTDGAVRPLIGLEAVERDAAPGAPRTWLRASPEPGGRGYLFVDSLIAFRTRASGAVVRFRLWNTGRAPISIVRDSAPPDARPGACPPAGGGLELRTLRRRGPDVVAAHGTSAEGEALPARLGEDAGPWRPVGLLCFVFDPVQDRIALRLAVESGGARHLYTFWYRVLRTPPEDAEAGGR